MHRSAASPALCSPSTMMPSPLRSMSPLAAAATEHRINGTWFTEPTINPDKDQSCIMRLRGDLTVRYKIRAVGGSVQPAAQTVHQEAPRSFDRSFDLDGNGTFFRSLAFRDAIHEMIEKTIGNELNLAGDNWDKFLHRLLAAAAVARFRRMTQELRDALRYNITMTLALSVDVIYDEPKAMLLACKRWEAAVAQGGGGRRFTAAECCVCMEGLTAEEEEDDNVVRLPCSHAFHCKCIAPWFYRGPTCPMCRHDMSNCLAVFTNTTRGKFPGLEP